MRRVTRSTLLAAVETDRLQWIVPTRLATGLLLLAPIEGHIEHLFAFQHAGSPSLAFASVAAGLFLRGIEVLAGVSFIAGFGIRLAAPAALAIFMVRALANSANSSASAGRRNSSRWARRSGAALVGCS